MRVGGGVSIRKGGDKVWPKVGRSEGNQEGKLKKNGLSHVPSWWASS